MVHPPSQGALLQSISSCFQGQAEVCFSEFKAALDVQGVPPTTPELCHVSAASALLNIGCYNYTTLQQQIPVRYFEYFAGNCTRASPNDCRHCTQTLIDVGTELANNTNFEYLNSCEQLAVHQYYQWLARLELVPEPGNCYYQFPPGLELTIVPLPAGQRSPNVGLIAGLSTAIAVAFLAVVAGAAFFFWRRYPLYKADWVATKKTLGRLSSLRQRFVESSLQVFTKKELSKATQTFSESRVLGVGGCGKVYVGELNGEVVAVKDATFGANKNGAKVRRRLELHG